MEGPSWEDFRPEIERLYVREDKPLPEVIWLMDAWGFSKTKSQYTRKFKEWGIQKYPMKSKDWKYVRRTIERRKNRESEVYIDGIQCPPAKVRKEISRHFESTVERYRAATSPHAPDRIVVCSPPPTLIHMEWDPGFPWFQFWKVIKPYIREDDFASKFARLTLCTTGSATKMVETSEFSLLRAFIQNKRITATVPHIAAFLALVMPEEHAGYHLDTASALFSSIATTTLRDRLAVELFLLSNNLLDSTERDDFGRGAGIHRIPVMDLFKRAGPNSLLHLKNISEVEKVTALAAAEKLFGSAVRSGDVEAARIMLKAGVDPDIVIPVPVWGGCMTPLAVAASITNERLALDMADVLLSHNADVNQMDDYYRSPLVQALQHKNKSVATLLLNHGAVITPTALQCAVKLGDVVLVRQFLESDVDVNARVRAFGDPDTILATAILEGNMEIIQMLLEAGADPRALAVDQTMCRRGRYSHLFHKATAVGITAQIGDIETVKLLLKLDPDFDIYPDTSGYGSPLILAVKSGHYGIAKLLLDAGADVHQAEKVAAQPLIEWIADKENLEDADIEFGRALLDAGAMTNRAPLRGRQNSTSALVIAIRRGNVQFVRLLLEYKVHIDEVLDISPSTALGQAIQIGNVEIIQVLQQGGGSNIGDGISSVGNMDVASYLHRAGILSEILRKSGPDILGSAILANQMDLVTFLLSFQMQPEMEPLLKTSASPLEAAVSMGNLEMIEFCLARGANITENVINAAVWSSLATGGYDILQLLLEAPKRLPREARISFAMAIRAKNIDLIQRLLHAGIKTATGAVKLAHCQCCKRMSTQQFRKHTGWWRDQERGVLSSSLLCEAIGTGDYVILREIFRSRTWPPQDIGIALVVMFNEQHNQDRFREIAVEITAAVNLNCEYLGSKNRYRTPLVAAVGSRQISGVRMLVEAGADVNYQRTPEPWNMTPLQQAVRDGSLQIVDLLLEEGAAVNALPCRDSGATALQFAVINGHLLIAKKLLDAGADVNAVRSWGRGRTALEGAAEHGRIEMLHLLITHGARIFEDGRSQYIRAIKLAEVNGHRAAAIFLKSHGGWTPLDAERYDEVNRSDQKVRDGFAMEYIDDSDWEISSSDSE